MPSDDKSGPNTPPDADPSNRRRAGRAKRRRGVPKRGYPTLTRNRLFAGLIVSVIGFALLAFLTLVSLAFFAKDPPTQLQSRLADVCYFVITTIIGALVGLVGGRAATPETWQSGEPKR